MRKVNTSRSSVTNMALTARAEGTTTTSFHGDCSAPREHHLFGYPDPILVALGIEREKTVTQYVTVRCRRCDECLRYRSRLWAAKGIAETLVARRTWFVTLTLAPEHALRSRYAAHARLTGGLVEAVTDDEIFAEQSRVINAELTLWLKRVRKNSGAALRYLLVCEAHKTGVPHWHALVHEDGDTPVSKRCLQEAWKFGFSNCKLIGGDDTKAVWYVCKYLAKSALTRVRASQHYGDVTSRLTERLQLAVTHLPKVSGRVACPARGNEAHPTPDASGRDVSSVDEKMN